MEELSWRRRGRLWLRLGARALLLGLAVWAAARLGPVVWSLCAPFLLAFAFAWILSPVVGWLHRKLGWPREVLTLGLLLLVFAGLFGLMWALVAGVAQEVASLRVDWEELLGSLQATLEGLNGALSRLRALLPAAARDTADNLTARLVAWLEAVVPRLLAAAADGVAGAVRGLPSFAVAATVFLMAAYFITAGYPSLRARAADSLPRGVRVLLSQVRRAASAGFGGYIKAQVILSAGVFFILLGGFFLIREDYAILLAFLLAVLDFVPILGSGTVMVPWAFVELFTGSFRRAVGLMAVWGVVALFRRVAEPKVLGNQTGLGPILSLASVYVGMRLAGVAGMVLAPVVCLVVRNITRAGVLDGLLQDLRLAAGDLSALLAPEENSKRD